MSKTVSTALAGAPGIQRDGTVLMAQNFLDGAWVRFYGGVPRKIGGWASLVAVSPEFGGWIVPGAPCVSIGAMVPYPWLDQTTLVLMVGDWGYVPEGLPGSPFVFVPVRYSVVPDGASQATFVSLAQDFPATGFWGYSTGLYACQSVHYPEPVILVCPFNARHSLDGVRLPPDPACPTVQNVWAFPVPSSPGEPVHARVIHDPLMDEDVTVSGGVCVVLPGYIFLYGSNGTILMNDPTAADPVNTFSVNVAGAQVWNVFVVAATKIVQGMSVLGAGMSAYFWSLNSVILCQIEQDNLPTFRTVCDSVSILSAASVVNVNNTFYWIGQDTFYAVSGNVQEVPNMTNRLWFFEQLNRACSGAVFGVVNRLFHEIWWFFPRGDSVQCNWALVYNYQDHFWYDTGLPGDVEDRTPPNLVSGGVTCGMASLVGSGPLVAGSGLQPGSAEPVPTVYQMEQGWDYQDIQGEAWAIPARITTSFTGLYNQNTSLTESWIHARRLEMDVRMNGSFHVQMIACHFPTDWKMGEAFQPFVQYEPENFSVETQGAYEVTSSTRYVDFSLQGRLMAVRLTQNCKGGMFHVGQMILDWQAGSGNSGKKTVN